MSSTAGKERQNDAMREDVCFEVRRHQSCYILRNKGIPCVVWFEDAVYYYGVPTGVRDLYVLVSDIDVAAEILKQSGWVVVPRKQGFTNVFEDCTQRCLLSPRSPCEGYQSSALTPASMRSLPIKAPTPTTTILLPAEDWNFSITQPGTKESFTTMIPPLATLLDALIDSLLDCHCDNDGLRSHLACLVCYLYDYVPELRKREFAHSLVYDHRQYHMDVLCGMSNGTLPFIRHQRKVRDALREGAIELQECSAPNSKFLFPGESEALILASMPNPFDCERSQSQNVSGQFKTSTRDPLSKQQPSSAASDEVLLSAI